MCFHTSLNVPLPELEARYQATLPGAEGLLPVYHANAYAFPAWPILTRQQPDTLQLMHWGLIPYWVKTGSDATDIRSRTINARSETMFEKTSFRSAARSGQRCLIPVTGFFEWHEEGGKKYPFFISARDQPIVSIAGLWDEWIKPGADPSEPGGTFRTYTMLTTNANALLSAIHNTKQRMPCVLTAEAEQAWLHDELTEADALRLLATPYPDAQLHSYSVGKQITSRTEPSDVPAVLERVDYPALSNNAQLFA